MTLIDPSARLARLLRPATAAIAMTAIALSMSASSSRADILIRAPKVSASSQIPGFKGFFRAESVDYSFVNPTNQAAPSRSGRNQGRPEASDLVFHTEDQAPVLDLLASSLRSSVMKEVEVHFTVSDDRRGQQTTMRLVLREVLVSSIQTSAAGNAPPRSTVSLDFAAMDVETYRIGRDGSPELEDRVSYDFRTNR